MANLRALIETDLKMTLEGDFSSRVNMIGPDGTRYESTVDGRDLVGQVLYNTVREGESFGTIGKIVLDTPVVTLRRSSLTRIPAAGEKWIIEIPESPIANAPFVQYTFSPTRPPEGGAAIGFIRLYLQAVEQSS